MRRWRLFWIAVCVVLAFPAVLAAKGKSSGGGEGGHGSAEHGGGGGGGEGGHGEKDKAAPPPALPPEEIVLPPLFKPPFELVRRLEIVQDRITRGSREAHVFQRSLIDDIAAQFAKTPEGVWKQPRNARAVVTYVLSGGDPFILQRMVKLNDLGGGVDANVIKGLIAYSRGQNEEAYKLLSKVHASALGSGAGGHLALAQATLAAEDPNKVMAYLDQARLLSPGTLVEEASLRRAVIISAKIGDGPKFNFVVSQYLRRFYKSVYTPNFLRSFALSFTTSNFAKDPVERVRLEAMLSSLPDDRQKAAYLALSEAAVLNGAVDLARLSAGKLVGLARNDPAISARARLYGAAVNIVTDGYDLAIMELKTIDRAKLNVRDRELLTAALSIAEQLHTLPPASDVDTLTTPPPPPASVTQGESVEMQDMPTAVVAGRKSIALADGLLNGTIK